MEQNLTTHAKVRCAQRGVRIAVALAVRKFGDIEMPSYGGCRRLQLSHKAVEIMLAEGVSIAEVDAARKLALIVDATDRVVTVIRLRSCDRRVRTKLTKNSNSRTGHRR